MGGELKGRTKLSWSLGEPQGGEVKPHGKAARSVPKRDYESKVLERRNKRGKTAGADILLEEAILSLKENAGPPMSNTRGGEEREKELRERNILA